MRRGWGGLGAAGVYMVIWGLSVAVNREIQNAYGTLDSGERHIAIGIVISLLGASLGFTSAMGWKKSRDTE
jgi:hypothetical protein